MNQTNAQKANTCLDGLWTRGIQQYNCSGNYLYEMSGNNIEPRPVGGAGSIGQLWKSRSRFWDFWVLFLVFFAVWL